MAIFWEPEAEQKASSSVFHHCNLLQWARVTFMTTYRGTLILGPQMKMKYKSLPSSYWIGTISCRAAEPCWAFPLALCLQAVVRVYLRIYYSVMHVFISIGWLLIEHRWKLHAERQTLTRNHPPMLQLSPQRPDVDLRRTAVCIWMVICIRGNNAVTRLSCYAREAGASSAEKDSWASGKHFDFIGLMIHERWHIAFLLAHLRRRSSPKNETLVSYTSRLLV